MGEVKSEKIPKQWLNSFIGGKGLGIAYLYEELSAGVDPLSLENKLLFMLGPLSGLAPGTRYCVVTKSPHTGAFLHSYSGGDFPSQLRFSLPNHLGIIIEGKARDSVYLKINNGETELKDASKLKGKNVHEVCDHFENKEVATIGPAGENLVSFSTVASDDGEHHAGRAGAGAVMGSKNLKALVVKGDRPELSEELINLNREEVKRLASSEGTRRYREKGTPRIVDMTNETGTLPTRNWTKGSFKDANKINLDAIKSKSTGKIGCYNCPVACRWDLEMEGYTGPQPEYETLGLIGSNLEIGDLSAVAQIGDLCNKLGLDTISTGNVIGWSMEASEKGLIDYEIEFGDEEKVKELVKEIAYREGMGEMLAEGAKSAGKQAGKEGEEIAVHVKGLEPPAYEPRGSFSMGLAYATSDRGACHMRAWAIGGDSFGDRDPYSAQKGHAEAVVHEQNLRSVVPDSLISCAFAAYTPDDAIKWLQAFSYKIDVEDIERIGERIWNLTRMFNVREGFSREDDHLPKRMEEEPLKRGGPADGQILPREELDKMLDWYYARRGWSKDGNPSLEKKKELNLDSF